MADLEVQQIPLMRPTYQPQAKALKASVTVSQEQMKPKVNRPAEPSHERMSDDEFIGKLGDIGTMLRKNVVSKRGGNEAGMQRVDKTYADFMKQAQGQKHVMENASDEQKDAYREMMEEMVKMRKDGSLDMKKSFEQMKRLVATVNEKEGPEHVKEYLEKMASTAMKNLDTERKPTGLLGVAVSSANKFFAADKKDEENPLFRYLAGMDKPKDPKKMISALEEAQNQGKSDKLKTQLGLDITGEGGDALGALDPMAKLLDQMVGKLTIALNGSIGGNGSGNGSGGSGKFPEKVENLYVENLIIKSMQRQQERDVSGAQGDKKLLSYEAKGKSALALPAPSTPSSGTGVATVEPKQIGHDKSHALTTVGNDVAVVEPKRPSTELGRPELRTYRMPERKKLGMSGHKGVQQKAIGYDGIEYTDFREVPTPEPKQISYKEVPQKTSTVKYPPITQKRQNKLKTNETVIAKAVRGALNVSSTSVEPKPTIVTALAAQRTNQMSSVKADATINNAGIDPEDIEPTAPAAPGAPAIDVDVDKKNVPDVDIDKPKKTVPKKVEKVGKVAKAAKVGKTMLKGAAVAGAVADVGMGVYDLANGKAQEDVPSGLEMLSPMRWGMYAGDKINKGIEYATGGQSLGSKIYDWTHKSDPASNVTPLKPKTMPQEIQMRPNDSGTKLNNLNVENASIKNAPAPTPAPVVINSGTSAPAPVVTNTIMPVGAAPRNRESYFDRMQMNTIVK